MYEDVLAYDYNNAAAHFGLAMTGMLTITTDQEFLDVIEEFENICINRKGEWTCLTANYM